MCQYWLILVSGFRNWTKISAKLTSDIGRVIQWNGWWNSVEQSTNVRFPNPVDFELLCCHSWCLSIFSTSSSSSSSSVLQVLKGSKKLSLSVRSVGRIPGGYVTNHVYTWVDPQGRGVSPPPDLLEHRSATLRRTDSQRRSNMQLLQEGDEKKVTLGVLAGAGDLFYCICGSRCFCISSCAPPWRVEASPALSLTNAGKHILHGHQQQPLLHILVMTTTLHNFTSTCF